ncbi:hypothetical protein Ahy_B02g060315 [Arachis hypogaea]|uniref:Protein FAR1-RELATED SEQUENCE n=1 Tax=Arachis hypogaea TaxID=3818 RepID=A0A445AI79_ARAHY|nr:hypothetical protein Ahy_B02g060315 [Arachis hypogaea]
MLKQHRELSMSVCRTIENNEEAGIRPGKTYQSFVVAARGHCELNFIEKDVRNYITREVWNVLKLDNAKEFESFDRNWNDFPLKYGLVDNKWLSGYLVYEVREQVSSSTFNNFAVSYDSVAAQVKCQYILEPWSKNVKRKHTHIKSSHDELLLVPRSKRFNELVFLSQNICEFASKSEELTAILHRAYDNVVVEMEELKAKRKRTCSLSHEDANLESVNELQSHQG